MKHTCADYNFYSTQKIPQASELAVYITKKGN